MHASDARRRADGLATYRGGGVPDRVQVTVRGIKIVLGSIGLLDAVPELRARPHVVGVDRRADRCGSAAVHSTAHGVSRSGHALVAMVMLCTFAADSLDNFGGALRQERRTPLGGLCRRGGDGLFGAPRRRGARRPASASSGLFVAERGPEV